MLRVVAIVVVTVFGALAAGVATTGDGTIDSPLVPEVPETRPSPNDAATYREAMAARDSGDLGAASVAFGAVADRGGTLAPIARLRLAQTLAADDRPREAAAAFETALADPALPGRLRSIAAFEGAAALLRSDREAEALALLDDAASDRKMSRNDRARAAVDAAALRRARNDARWFDDATAAIESAPSSAAASDALDMIENAGIEFDPMQAAAVRYRNFENDAAFAHYTAVLADPPTRAAGGAASFYLGAIYERWLLPEEAADAYAASIAFDSDGPLADDAHWWRGRIFEDLGQHAGAVAQYDALARDFPRSPFADEARLRAALSLLRNGDEGEAIPRLRDLARDGDELPAAAAARWLAVAGEDGPAAGEIAPGSLFAVLDETGGRVRPADDRLAPAELGPRDWLDVVQWMDRTFGPRPATDERLVEDDAFLLAVALDEVGERPVAAGLFSDLVHEHRDRPYELLDLAQLSSDHGRADVAIAATRELLRAVPPDERVDVPRAILVFAYPAPFFEALADAAEAEGVSPLLLLALVRQESAFDPDAGSSAGASGLTQVIAPTGEQIARELGVPWNPPSLFEPETSLRFGAYYLARQLERFDGDLLAALAAYNAGPGNAERWIEGQSLPGGDGFVAAVDFGETRLYLERVVENYAWYRYIYGEADHPGLG